MSQIELLRAGLSKLGASDVNFAKSLIDQHDKGKTLSPKQLYYVGAFVKEITPPDPDEVPDFSDDIDLGDVSGILALFDKAKKHLKYPKIRLALPDQSAVVLTVAGNQAKHPGAINVTDGRKYPNNTFYGRVSPNGTWDTGSGALGEAGVSVFALLLKMAGDPAKTAAEFGKLTGNCAFCMLPLSDPKSTAVGYGKVCASHYGLPWGN